jgi:hypothetical protein
MQILNRLKRLESRMPALARAYALLGRGVPFVDWPQPELEVFTAESPEIQQLSDAELEALAFRDDSPDDGA